MIMNKQALRQTLYQIDFEIIFSEGFFTLKDLQGANLGDIESEYFHSPEEVLDRMEHYYKDIGSCGFDIYNDYLKEGK